MNAEDEFNINCGVVRLYGGHTGMGTLTVKFFCNLSCSIISNANQSLTRGALDSSLM